MDSGLTALVFGANGLTGSLLVQQLLSHPSFSKVKVFGRHHSALQHPRLEKITVNNFSDTTLLGQEIKGDVLFCCLGTTIRKAGSQAEFEKVDLHYPELLARIAAKNGVQKFLMISSMGANKDSSNFYLRTKGKAEEAVAASGVPQVYFFRPGLLLGKRKEFRMGELIGKFFMQMFSVFMIGSLRKYRAVNAKKVANAMLHFSLRGNEKMHVAENVEILDLPVEK